MTSLAMNGTITVGPYLGYHGRAEYDSDANHFHGEVIGTRDVITFVGVTPKEVENEFKTSVEVYLELCASLGEEPEKPYSGKFLVRIDPRLHRELSVRAEKSGTSLNQLVADALAKVIDSTNEFSKAAAPKSETSNLEESVPLDVVLEGKPMMRTRSIQLDRD